MPTVSETNCAYIPRFQPYQPGNEQVPMVTQIDTKPAKPEPPSEVKVDVNELPQVSTASPTTTKKIVLIVAILALCGTIAVVVPVVVTQTSKKGAIASPTTTTTAMTVTTTTATTATSVTTTTITTTTTSTSTSTSSTSSTTSTTRAPHYMQITGANDTVVGVYNTTAGSSSSGWIGNYPSSENPPNVFDGNTGTKYLNFGNGGTSSTAGVNTGFYTTPYTGASLAMGILFATANDASNRDPITITLEGSSNASTLLPLGTSWTLIYSGPTGISSTVDPGRTTYVGMQNFSNAISYTSYRVLVTSQRGSDNSVQYSEANIFGIA